jgi:hypothetical protein
VLKNKGKYTVIPLLNYVIKHYAMKAYGGIGGIAPPFLTSALDELTLPAWVALPGAY